MNIVTFLFSVVSAGLVLASHSAAFACESMGVAGWDWNKRIKVLPDCGFENAGRRTPAERDAAGNVWKSVPHDNTSGEAAIDIGNGLVSQIVKTWGSCSVAETLIVLDCHSVDAVAIGGIYPADTSNSIQGFSAQLAKYAVGPEGRVQISADNSLSEFRAAAQTAGLSVVDDVMSLQEGWRRRDRYDPFCGCKLYYPSSEGAIQ